MSSESEARLADALKAATRRAHRYREALLRIAARAENYSSVDIEAAVATALEVTVKKLRKMLEEDE